MFWSKKTEIPKIDPPPPWANIDNVPRLQHDQARVRLNIVKWTQAVTGFGIWPTRFLLLLLSAAIAFAGYAYYFTAHTPPPLPRQVNRPAMDKYASTTIRL